MRLSTTSMWCAIALVGGFLTGGGDARAQEQTFSCQYFITPNLSNDAWRTAYAACLVSTGTSMEQFIGELRAGPTAAFEPLCHLLGDPVPCLEVEVREREIEIERLLDQRESATAG